MKQHPGVTTVGALLRAGRRDERPDRERPYRPTVERAMDDQHRDREPVPASASRPTVPTDLEVGWVIGLLVGSGHFGGDGRQIGRAHV